MRLSTLAATIAISTTSLSAATIDSALVGISDADVVVNFNEGRDITASAGAQYSSFGVTFSEPISYFSNPMRANFDGTFAGNFGGSPFGFSNPFTISFDRAVSAASFNMTRNLLNNSTMFSALLDGMVVESFTTSVVQASNSIKNNFYGFEGVTFDQISIGFDGNGNAQGAGLDNLSYQIAAVPLPAALPMMLAGLGGLAFLRRRQSQA